MTDLMLEQRIRRTMMQCARRIACLSLFALASCQSAFGASDNLEAVGQYVLQSKSDSSKGLVVSGAMTLNADHTFSEVESIRIIGGPTSTWSSSGTWTLNGIRLVKVHKAQAGSVTELAVLVGDTVKAGWAMLVRK